MHLYVQKHFLLVLINVFGYVYAVLVGGSWHLGNSIEVEGQFYLLTNYTACGIVARCLKLAGNNEFIWLQ